MAPNKNKGGVSENFRIEAEHILRLFIQNEHEVKYEFPNNYSSAERAWLHNLARSFGLKSKSHGKDVDRKLTIYKPDKFSGNNDSVELEFTNETRTEFNNFVAKYPSSAIKNDFFHKQKRKTEKSENSMGQLTSGIAQYPVLSINQELLHFRMSLPIWAMRSELMEQIINNQITLISGETGSGKTTQLPQFILDYCASRQEKCRIICTQPRRISAMGVSERVATERNEKIGQSVGYHIRLESCVGPKTVLIYCTNGILLRTLMGGDHCLNSFTHVIVDEIHERDRFSDFLMICLRENLCRHPNLKIILMSATMDTENFQKYFGNIPVAVVPGRTFPVEEYFLEDVLMKLNYMSPEMKKCGKLLKKENKSKVVNNSSNCVVTECSKPLLEKTYEQNLEMDECIIECIEDGTEDALSQFLQMVLSEHVPINYPHSENKYTGLMAAALHGNYEMIEQFLSFGADPSLKCKDGLTAYDLACSKQHLEVAEMLKAYEDTQNQLINKQSLEENAKEKELLDLYHRTISDQMIDFKLLVELVVWIHKNQPPGAILIFLSGYDEIVNLKEQIGNESRLPSNSYRLYMLHSCMQSSDQQSVFAPLIKKRKIILSTNIAETGITIDDVVYVIDSGRVKERNYDAIIGVSSLQSMWISKACATQRKGRAGRSRPGICYRLFSYARFSSMQPFATPEILRMPLHELCLQTKLLAPVGTKIDHFLSLAPEPPSNFSVRNSIAHLQQIGALDENEDLTGLGRHVLELSVEPRLGKMLLFGVMFKCLDPILTIAACLDYRDPFMLPAGQKQRQDAVAARRLFSAATFSDHMTFLRAFQAWQEAKVNRSERSFCAQHLLSGAAMEMIVSTRSQLLAQLRACGFVRTRPPGDIRQANLFSHNWALVKAVLTAGCCPNIARLNRSSNVLQTRSEKKVLLHPGSVLRDSANRTQAIKKLPTDWLVFEEMSRVASSYSVRTCTVVNPLTIALFADLDMPVLDSDSPLYGWISFSFPCNTSYDDYLIENMRKSIRSFVNRRIQNPLRLSQSVDDDLVMVVASALSAEDCQASLLQPHGVGTRPRITCNEWCQSINSNLPESRMKNVNRRLSALSVNNSRNEEACAISKPVENRLPNKGLVDIFDPFSTSCFVIKAGSINCIDQSINKRTWILSPHTEKKLLNILTNDKVVLLFFTTGTGTGFHGMARLLGGPLTVDNQSTIMCPIEWMSRADIPFEAVRGMPNSWVDGDEMPKDLALQLSYLFVNHIPQAPLLLESDRPVAGRAIRGLRLD